MAVTVWFPGIRLLEAEAGMRLIARDGRGVTLTEAGRVLVAGQT